VLPPFSQSDSGPRAYLFQTTRNIVLEQARRSKIVRIDSVTDMDAAVAHFRAIGLEVGMMAPLQPGQPPYNIHMMETADKLGVDVELFHRVICCDRDAYFNGNLHRLDNDPSPR